MRWFQITLALLGQSQASFPETRTTKRSQIGKNFNQCEIGKLEF